jgi:hypothetical protein
MFEEISEKFLKIIKDIADSTQQQLDVRKMKSYMKKEEATMENAYKEIGKLFYKQKALEMPEEYEEYVNAVSEAKARIFECKGKIDSMKGTLFCKVCDHKTKEGMNFCPNCGAKISELEASADTDNKEKLEDLVKADIVYE